ncbi:MAG: hypothetical protein AAF772_19855 [Acidobacteriota bacterium]
MRSARRSRFGSGQRPLAAALALLWMMAGIAPAVHHHASHAARRAHHLHHAHCNHAPPASASAQPAAQVPTRHALCGLCVKLLMFNGFEKPLLTLADEAAAPYLGERSRSILPAAPPGRDGAARAPPRVV